MTEVTLESLARRVEALERAIDLKSRSVRPKDWRRVVGMFGNSAFQKQVDAEGRAIREAERAEARRAESRE
jgi:hypothetical protein